MARTARWRLWCGYVAVWTTMLLLPAPGSDGLPDREVIEGRKFLIAKTLHVAAYAVMTVLSGWLRLPARFRWLLMFFLMGHATATELIQQYVPNRTGELRDVALDHLGVAIGLLLSWNWWIKNAEDPPPI